MRLRREFKTKRGEGAGESRGGEDRKSVGLKLIVWRKRAVILWIAGCRGRCWEVLLRDVEGKGLKLEERLLKEGVQNREVMRAVLQEAVGGRGSEE